MVQEIRNIQRQSLANGLTIITEQMTHLRSISIGIWIKSGSRDEDLARNGIAHFIEHMVFKGTESRSAEAIAREVDSIGGNLDAFTSKEYICFSIKVLDEHLPIAMDLLADMVLRPTFAGDDITKERGVILEEIKMDEDNPDYLVFEIFSDNFWKNHPLGKPILGTRDTVKKFDPAVVREWYKRFFHPSNMIIAAAGNVDHKAFADVVGRYFADLAPGTDGHYEKAPVVDPKIILKNKKSLEQVQICLGVPAHGITHSDRYVGYLLNTVLGGGMSSRLFQNIREQRGMAYSIGSDITSYRDTGCYSVYAGTSLTNANKAIQLTMEEFKKMRTEPLCEEELNRAKAQMKGGMMLGLESSGARMSSLARAEMFFGTYEALDQRIARIDAVTAEQVQAMAQDLFKTEQVAVTVLGNLSGLKLRREMLEC